MKSNLMQIELDILKEFKKQCPKLKEAVDNSLKHLQSIKREFTGVGAFNENYKSKHKNLSNFHGNIWLLIGRGCYIVY